MTVRLVVLFFKGSFVELSEAEGADEVFGMELPEHGRDAAACDGLVTASAERTPLPMVMSLAVRLTFVLEERTTMEWLTAFLAYEAVRVPLCVEC